MTLNQASPVLAEYHKAKRLHWNPRDLDLQADLLDWQRLNARDREGLLQLCALFLAGEEAVTHDLAPLMIALRQRGGYLEEQLFLATQLYEEAKHFEFFDYWLTGVVAEPIDFARYYTPSYQVLFFDELPACLGACLSDHSARTLAQASVCYHILIEGVMAETGYYSFARAIKVRRLFPGLLQGVQLVQRDEARHIAFGLHLIAQLVGEAPEIWPEVVVSMNSGLVLCTGALSEAFERYPQGQTPFDLDPNDTIAYAARQFQKRYAALERFALAAQRGQPLPSHELWATLGDDTNMPL